MNADDKRPTIVLASDIVWLPRPKPIGNGNGDRVIKKPKRYDAEINKRLLADSDRKQIT